MEEYNNVSIPSRLKLSPPTLMYVCIWLEGILLFCGLRDDYEEITLRGLRWKQKQQHQAETHDTTP